MILASGSPRRQNLLSELGLEFQVVVRDVEEKMPDGLTPAEVAEYLARLKSDAYKDLAENNIIVTADTLVALRGQILGKPADRDEAIRMLEALSANVNQVISAVCLRYREQLCVFHEVSRVYFRKLDRAEIEYYVDHFAPYDKAGAYGIQEWIGMVGIERIDGDYYNVVGLPVPRLWEELKKGFC